MLRTVALQRIEDINGVKPTLECTVGKSLLERLSHLLWLMLIHSYKTVLSAASCLIFSTKKRKTIIIHNRHVLWRHEYLYISIDIKKGVINS